MWGCLSSLLPNRLLQCRLCRFAPTHHIRLQTVINAVASLVLRVKMFDHISTLMRDELQWLIIGERIRIKLSILKHNKCLNNRAPPYLVDKIRPLDQTARSRGCDHQNRLMSSCHEPRLNGRSGLSGRWSSLAYLEQSSCNYSENPNPSRFQKTVETVQCA